MTEPIRCPGCSTRFALHAERIHAGIRRAKCFRCETVFEIGDAVDALLASTAPAPEPEPLSPPALEVPPAPEEIPELEFPPAPQIELQAPEPGPTAPQAEMDSLFARFDEPPPSLTLGDLEGPEEEIMEKTLVILPPEPVPEPSDPTAAGGYVSAKDAIFKLMGDVPEPAATTERRFLGSRSPMDVEATLNALEDTLSGTTPLPSEPVPETRAEAPATTSTMKLTAQEIQAAMTSYAAAQPAPSPAPRPLQDTQPLHAGQAHQATQPIAIPQVIQTPQPTAAPGSELLKIQGEQETHTHVSVEQVIAWIEQGRVREYHMVARQFSDNWIEAIKVPALRPAFERKRRDESGKSQELSAVPPPDLVPAKKSLFGGLFGRN